MHVFLLLSVANKWLDICQQCNTLTCSCMVWYQLFWDIMYVWPIGTWKTRKSVRVQKTKNSVRVQQLANFWCKILFIALSSLTYWKMLIKNIANMLFHQCMSKSFSIIFMSSEDSKHFRIYIIAIFRG